MKIRSFTRATAIAGALTLAGAGAAFADEASITNTGPDSANSVKITENNSWNVSNKNSVSVVNNNTQMATTGDATVSRNTSGGNAQSGNASNTNSVTTNVQIGNDSVAGGGGSGSGGSGGGQGSGGGAGSGGSNAGGVSGGGSTAGGAGGGLVYGGAGGGVATLPKVGCEGICDVSALRAGYNDNIAAQATERARGISAGLLTLAAILSLAGAGGSALFARKQS